MPDVITCPDCGGEMEEGFVPEFMYPGTVQSQWHRGSPRHETFFGLDVGSQKVSLDPKQMLPITTYRCCGCAVLKFYAAKP